MFKPTNIDGHEVTENKETTLKDGVQGEQNKDESKTDEKIEGNDESQDQKTLKTQDDAIQKGTESDNDGPNNGPGQTIEHQQNTDTSEGDSGQEDGAGSEEVKFETAAVVDFDEPKKKEESIDTTPGTGQDLLAFLNENSELVTEYQSLNINFDELEQNELIKAHMQQQYPKLSDEKINILMEDYSVKEGDESTEGIKKEIAIEKASVEAKAYFTQRKNELHQELANRNLGGLTESQIQAQQSQQEAVNVFRSATDTLFDQGFEGFDFKIGNNKGMKIRINNPEVVKQQQSDINNVIGKFFDTNTGQISDPAGYHRAIFAASHADQLAEHFYQQGRADALTEEEKKANNIDMSAKTGHGNTPTKGTKWSLMKD